MYADNHVKLLLITQKMHFYEDGEVLAEYPLILAAILQNCRNSRLCVCVLTPHNADWQLKQHIDKTFTGSR